MLLCHRFEKKVRYATRKARADVRKRVKGRFVKAGDAYDYDPLSQTRSCWLHNFTEWWCQAGRDSCIVFLCTYTSHRSFCCPKYIKKGWRNALSLPHLWNSTWRNLILQYRERKDGLWHHLMMKRKSLFPKQRKPTFYSWNHAEYKLGELFIP